MIQPSAKSAQIPGLADSSDDRWSRITHSSTQPTTLNDRLTSAVDKNIARRSSDRRKSDRRQSSADDRERPKDVIFTDANSPFHLWYLIPVRIGAVYESAGHYLVTKSLGMEITVMMSNQNVLFSN